MEMNKKTAKRRGAIRGRACALAALALVLGGAGSVAAQSVPTPATTTPGNPDETPAPPTQGARNEAFSLPRTFPNQNGITGDWGGLRTRLAKDGVEVFGSFQTQTADILSGGVKRASDSNFQVILGTNLELQKLI